MKMLNYKKQQGYSFLSVILLVVSVIIVIGVWGFSGQNSKVTSGNNSNKVQASSVMNDATMIKAEYDRLRISGSSASSIVFKPNIASTSTSQNILDPAKGIQIPKANKNIIRTTANVPEGIWVYNGNMIMLAGIKDSVCKNINNSLYSSEIIPAVSSVANASAFVTGATVALPNTSVMLDLSATPVANSWNSGCVSANGVTDNNVYFRSLISGGCGIAPTVTQTANCPSGYTGSWIQTRTYTATAAPTCWIQGGWTPSTAPAGACTASCPPYGFKFQWCYLNRREDVYDNGTCGYIYDDLGYCSDPNGTVY